jgi:hypothetical protein
MSESKRLLTPERISKLSVEDAVKELRSRQPKVRAKACKYEYQPFQRQVTLLKDIADIEPYQLTLPEPPPIHEFINYGLDPKEQVFQKVVIPEKLLKIIKAVRLGAWGGQKYTREDGLAAIEADEELADFTEMLWLKRLSGDWQLINGVPYHISPTYWYYLNFWEMNIGLPDFRTDNFHYCTDHWFFAFWDYVVVPNPYCEGVIEFAMRQTGKSYRLGVIVYEAVSRNYEWNGGIQSKTDSDGALLFEKAVVKPWRKQPFFFMPIYSNSNYPKKAIEFTPPAKKGRNAAIDTLDNDELMGWIDFAASSLDGYDGATLHRYGDDECGKVSDLDIYERYKTVRPSMRTTGGKSYHTSTVEELTKRGGKYFKYMWDDSDRHPTGRGSNGCKVDENGETVSGLWPWFMPAYTTYSFDFYGISIVDKITEEQKRYVRSIAAHKHIKHPDLCGIAAIDRMIEKETDIAGKQDIIRKNPRNIKEAFSSAQSNNYFRTDIINKRLEYFTHGYTSVERPYMQFGNFEWVNNVFLGNVEFVEVPYEMRRSARIWRVKLPNEDTWANKRTQSGTKIIPANERLFCGSSDTYKYNTKDIIHKSKMSDGAAHIFAYYNSLIDGNVPDNLWLTDDFILEYLGRPDTVREYCEDVLKIAVYYGCKIYPENNLDNVAMFFKDYDCEKYIQVGRHLVNKDVGIVYADGGRGGITTLPQAKETMFRLAADYVKRAGHRCKFYRTLQDFKDVEFEKLNPYDLFVSSACCLISAWDINNPAKFSKQQIDPENPPFGAKELRRLVYGY